MAPSKPTNDASPFNRKAQHDAKRIAILSEAARLFNGKGSRSTTLQDVAKGLGLTKTSLYYYVRTKEELIFQCYEASLQRQHAVMDQLDAMDVTPLERAARVFRTPFENWIRARDGDDVHLAAPLEIASLRTEHREQIEHSYIEMFKRLRGYLRDAIDAGQIRPVESTSTTRALIGATDWVFHWLHQLDHDDVLTAADRAWDFLLHGFYAGEGEYRPGQLDVSHLGDRPSQGFDRDEQNRQKQEAFYKTGTRFFNRKGFAGASLDEIAEYLNVSKGAFYYHIKNKEDLLYACYERSIGITRRIYARVEREDSSALERMDEAVRRIFHAQNSELGPLIRYNTITALPTPRRIQILDETEQVNEAFTKLINEGKQDGSIRDVDAFVARNLMNGATNAAMDINLWRRVDDIDQAAIEYFDVFFNGLLPRA